MPQDCSLLDSSFRKRLSSGWMKSGIAAHRQESAVLHCSREMSIPYIFSRQIGIAHYIYGLLLRLKALVSVREHRVLNWTGRCWKSPGRFWLHEQIDNQQMTKSSKGLESKFEVKQYLPLDDTVESHRQPLRYLKRKGVSETLSVFSGYMS